MNSIVNWSGELVGGQFGQLVGPNLVQLLGGGQSVGPGGWSVVGWWLVQ
jgi:hypothetical protein